MEGTQTQESLRVILALTWGNVLVQGNPSWKGAATQRPDSLPHLPKQEDVLTGCYQGAMTWDNILAPWTLTLGRGYSCAKARSSSRSRVSTDCHPGVSGSSGP